MIYNIQKINLQKELEKKVDIFFITLLEARGGSSGGVTASGTNDLHISHMFMLISVFKVQQSGGHLQNVQKHFIQLFIKPFFIFKNTYIYNISFTNNKT